MYDSPHRHRLDSVFNNIVLKTITFVLYTLEPAATKLDHYTQGQDRGYLGGACAPHASAEVGN